MKQWQYRRTKHSFYAIIAADITTGNLKREDI